MIKKITLIFLLLIPSLALAAPPTPVESVDADRFTLFNVINHKFDVRFKGWNRGSAFLHGYHLPSIEKAKCPAERSRGINAQIIMYDEIFVNGNQVNISKRKSVKRRGYNYSIEVLIGGVKLGRILERSGLAVEKKPGVPAPKWCP